MIYLIGCGIAYVAYTAWLMRLRYRQYLKERARDEQQEVGEAQPQIVEMPPLIVDGTAVNRNGGNGHHGEFIMRRE